MYAIKEDAIDEAIGRLKCHSSKWIKTMGDDYKNFYRQDGAFSVNYKGVDRVVKYIANRNAHHRRNTFQDEFRGILKDQVEYGHGVAIYT